MCMISGRLQKYLLVFQDSFFHQISDSFISELRCQGHYVVYFGRFHPEKNFHFDKITFIQSFIGRSGTHQDQLILTLEPFTGLAQGCQDWLWRGSPGE